jgi:hypothetical protein
MAVALMVAAAACLTASLIDYSFIVGLNFGVGVLNFLVASSSAILCNAYCLLKMNTLNYSRFSCSFYVSGTSGLSVALLTVL